MTSDSRQELAYWLALAFALPRVRVRDKNSLVLDAARDADLSLLELVARETEDLPKPLQRWASVHASLLEAEGRVSAQAFVVDRLAQAKLGLLPITHADYPAHLLRRLRPDKAPTLLSVAGDVALLRESGVAISGSRKAGAAGLAFARAIGRALAEQGVVVVSGLARGVDSEAMDGALEAGGRVIGVSAEGILATRAIRRRELHEGRLTVISEFEPGARWAGWAAMRRNSTIAGMSRALVIADCVAEGGTTAQFDVHRDLGLPVYIRRGPGEGRLMAELAARPGALELPWAHGDVNLPGGLRRSEQEPRGLRCSVRREHGRLRVNVDAPDSASLPELIDALRAEYGRATALHDEATYVVEEPTATHAAESSAAYQHDAARDPAGSSRRLDTSDDPILHALAQMHGRRATVADLCERVGWSANKVRMRLRSLVEAGKLNVERSGRTHVYSPVVDGQDDATTPAPRSQLELLSG